MKKVKRILALLLALILVCLSATGCNAIDDMRARHGYYTESGSIMLGKTEYRLLPTSKYLATLDTGDGSVYVTDKDVPVLLSTTLGTGFDSYNDGLILRSEDYVEVLDYCRADKYDELVAKLEEGFTPTGYCYTYSVFDTETKTYKERAYRLTEEQEEAVRDITATVVGEARDEYARYNNDFNISLYACSDDMLLQDYRYTIEKTHQWYYLVEYDNVTGMDLVYDVPDEKYAIFDAICKCQVDAEKAEEQYYSDLYGYDEDVYDLDYELA